jgi:hypothetical protein
MARPWYRPATHRGELPQTRANPKHSMSPTDPFMNRRHFLQTATVAALAASVTSPLLAQTPATPNHGRRGIEQIEPISDLLSIHPCWLSPANIADDANSRSRFERLLDDYVSFAVQVRKPLLATETCWGALDDAKRVNIVRYTLKQLKQRNIGSLVYLLHHSQIADAHRAEFGPVSGPGNLSFIEADGPLRPGHEVYNEFCP